MPTADSNRPHPAAIDGRRWTVRGSTGLGGGTSTKRADMFVPFADTPTARMIRNHELVHARITPHADPVALVKKHAATFEALQWSEDYRVALFMDKRDELAPPDALTDAECDFIAANVGGDRRMAAGAMLGHFPLEAQRGRIFDALIRAGWKLDDLLSIESALCAAIDGASAGLRRSRRRAGAGPVIEDPRGFAKFTAPLARLFDAAFPPGGGDGAAQKRGAAVDRIKGEAKWAPLRDIVRLPLTRAVRPRRPVGRRFSDCGVIPTAVHRLPVDGAIFGTRRRAKGGTILCDASGSMNYDDDDIGRIIAGAPAAKLAFYAGSAGRRGAYGALVVAADRGRAANYADVRRALPGGNNYVDAPALRWLAKQPEPRVWVSDQEVGGVSDFGRGGVSHADCMRICSAANIRIVGSIDELR